MPGADAFYASASRGGLYAGAIEPFYSPFGGDFMGGSPVAGMMLQAAMPQLLGGEGFLGGQFLPTQNLHSQIQARQYQAARLQALQAGFGADRASYVDTMKGLARMTGTPFGLEQARAADVIAGDVAAVMPYVAPMMPGLADQLHGPAGSRGLLADSIFRRGLHEVDPVTGAVGLTPESASARAAGIYRNLYQTGTPGSGLAAMRGIGAGSAGQLYSELERMGLAAPVSAEAARGVRAKAEDAIPGSGDMAVRAFDSKQSAERIKQLAGAVSAMRDLFGDNGRPDAPMPVLMKAINDLTQGGLSTMDPRRVEQTVRAASSTARQAGVSLDAMAGLMAHAAGQAEGLGIDRSFGAEAATHGLAFGAAMADVGRLDVAAPGRLSKEKYTALDTALRVRAAAAPMAGGLAALMRFQDEMGGRLAAGSDAARIADAIRSGRPLEERDQLALLDPAGMTRMLREGGVDHETMRSLMEDREGSQAAMQKYGLADTVRRAQPLEARRVAESAFRVKAQGMLLGRGIGQGEAEAASRRLAEAQSRALFAAGREQTATVEGRQKVLADAAHAAFSPEELKRLGLDDAALQQLNVTGFAEFNRSSNRVLGQSAQATLDVMNDKVMKQADVRREQAGQDAAMQKAMSSLGRAGPMARLVGILQNPTIDPKTGKFDLAADVSKALGGVSAADLTKSLADANTADKLYGGASASTRMLAMSRGMQAAGAEFEQAKAAGDRMRVAEVTARVEAMAGGDAETAGRSLQALLRRNSLKWGDIDAVIAGTKGDASLRDQVRGLVAARRANMNATAAEAGVAVGSKITSQDAGGARRQLERAHELSTQAAGQTGKAREETLDLARRVRRSGLDRSRALADAALGDEASLAALGAGGISDVQAARDKSLELEALAKQYGMTPEQLLASEAKAGPEAVAAGKARGLYGDLHAAVGAIEQRLAAPGNAKYKLSPAEKDRFAALQKSERGDQAGRNKDAIKDMLRKLHGADIGDDEVDKLAAGIGTGAEGDLNVARLRAGVEAAQKLDAGVSDKDQREHLEKVAGSLKRIGAPGGSHVGDDLGTIKDSVKEYLGGRAEGAGGEKNKMEITGELTLRDDGKVQLSGKGTPTIGGRKGALS